MHCAQHVSVSSRQRKLFAPSGQLPAHHGSRRAVAGRRVGAGHVIVCTASSPVPPAGRVGTLERVKNLFSELRKDTRGFMQRRRQRYGSRMFSYGDRVADHA